VAQFGADKKTGNIDYHEAKHIFQQNSAQGK
jgi:hypothetical protein